MTVLLIPRTTLFRETVKQGIHHTHDVTGAALTLCIVVEFIYRKPRLQVYVRSPYCAVARASKTQYTLLFVHKPSGISSFTLVSLAHATFRGAALTGSHFQATRAFVSVPECTFRGFNLLTVRG